MNRFEFDGAENIAFWVEPDDESVTPIPIMFDELPALKEFLNEMFPGIDWSKS